VGGVDARDAFDDSALLDGLVDLVGDVPNGQPACGPELGLSLVDPHRPYSEDSGGLRKWEPSLQGSPGLEAAHPLIPPVRPIPRPGA
jgi:hypothetical protein